MYRIIGATTGDDMTIFMSGGKPRTIVFALAVAGSIWCTGSAAQSQEMLARELLVDMARNQFSVLCQSEVFASCMGFTTKSCLELSESASDQCLMTLPKEINPEELDNAALESCPQEIYAEAGYSEEQAGLCFDKAMDAAAAAEGKK